MNAFLGRLIALERKPSRVVVGLISGTSADAIDAAVCRVEGSGIPSPDRPGARVRLVHYAESAYEPTIRELVQRAGELTTRQIAELHRRVGEAFADACLAAVAALAEIGPYAAGPLAAALPRGPSPRHRVTIIGALLSFGPPTPPRSGGVSGPGRRR